jgi:hypothetical protein
MQRTRGADDVAVIKSVDMVSVIEYEPFSCIDRGDAARGDRSWYAVEAASALTHSDGGDEQVQH